MIKLSESLKDKVTRLLTEREEYRDDDNKLIARLQWDHYKSEGKDPKNMTGFDVLADIRCGRLLNFESIRRMRQKVQEDHPELRGRSYRKRMEHQEVIKEELGYH